MPRPSLHLTSPKAIARRQYVLDEALLFYQTIDITQDQARESFPTYIAAAEDYILNSVSNLPESDQISRLGRAGCLSEEYVTWLVDRALWEMIFARSHFSTSEVREAYMNVAPEPEVYASPFDKWLYPALKTMAEEKAGDASQPANVKTEVQVASSSRPVDPAPAPAPTPANVTSKPTGKQVVLQETPFGTPSAKKTPAPASSPSSTTPVNYLAMQQQPSTAQSVLGGISEQAKDSAAKDETLPVQGIARSKDELRKMIEQKFMGIFNPENKQLGPKEWGDLLMEQFPDKIDALAEEIRAELGETEKPDKETQTECCDLPCPDFLYS
ncbi:hypothetical protein PG993_010489 [Apiospora rasikravindrae]|uniref:Uncharacterized protein n=1 Tax=Apiospora rasikravindrae TaxID=990691 RepID=A0ABR1SP44_9PEZI